MADARTGEDPALPSLADLLLEIGRSHASALHLESTPNGALIRYRIDGVLHDRGALGADAARAVFAAIEEHVGPEKGDSRQPRTEYFEWAAENGPLRIHAEFLPGLNLGRWVLRPHLRRKLEYRLDALGLESEQVETLRRALHARPGRMIILAGPNNSGKATTLYSMIVEARKRGASVATAEWALRAQLPGVCQIRVRPELGLTFAALGRQFLHSDVDVAYLAELSDYETAAAAMLAVLGSGQTVLTSIHCPESVGVLQRLSNMGIEAWQSCESIGVVQSQRLLRRLCPDCREQHPLATLGLVAAGLDSAIAERALLFRPRGCTKCGNTGYRGSVLIAETLEMSEPLAEALLHGCRTETLRRKAIEGGLVTLRQRGLRAAGRGLTSLDEVTLRTPPDSPGGPKGWGSLLTPAEESEASDA